MTHQFRLAALAAIGVALAGCTTVSEQMPQKVIRQHSDVQLSQESVLKFNEFKSYNFFAAMYVTEEGDGGGRAGGAPTLSDAKRISQSMCEAYNPGDRCILLSTVEPADASKTEELPKHIFDALTRARSRTTEGNYFALAFTPSGQFGTAFNYSSIGEAKRTALLECETAAARSRSNDTITEAKANSKAGSYKCQLYNL
ncbi:hypothetical protein So717_20430 [Roseobacter cerasinus]|uniref:Lipoprotein n=1 Tax=Roseobacter cerasinus TaxID=2602289 RepID=A0A640VS87_9RHOB|nr:hypothetical protein [Roseobacter cerasinus]GFE50290.1 hypothetical protein So717_20430 [Roseobacter cerasinus]